jgi:hypothetical protein
MVWPYRRDSSVPAVERARRVGGHLLVDPHPAKRQPDERVKPVQNLQKAHEPRQVDVTAFQMGQFMKEDVVQSIEPQRFHQSVRQEDTWAQETEKGRRLDSVGDHHAHKGPDSHLHLTVFQKFQNLLSVTGRSDATPATG